MTFGEAIIKLRSERRISQRQLAEELNVSFTSVNRWENGFPHLGRYFVNITDKVEILQSSHILVKLGIIWHIRHLPLTSHRFFEDRSSIQKDFSLVDADDT